MSFKAGSAEPLDFMHLKVFGDGTRACLSATAAPASRRRSPACGFAHTLDFIVRPSIERGALVPVLARWRPDPIEVYAAYPRSPRYSTKVRVFVDWTTMLFGAL